MAPVNVNTLQMSNLNFLIHDLMCDPTVYMVDDQSVSMYTVKVTALLEYITVTVTQYNHCQFRIGVYPDMYVCSASKYTVTFVNHCNIISLL